MRPADDPLAALRVGELAGAASDAQGVRNEVLASVRDNGEYETIAMKPVSASLSTST